MILGVLRHGDRTHGRVARKHRRLAILIRTTSQVGRAVLRHIASLSSRPFRSRRSFRTNSSCPFHRVSLRALATLLRLITQGYRPVIEHADTSRRVPACYRSGGVQRCARCRCRAAIAAGLQGQLSSAARLTASTSLRTAIVAVALRRICGAHEHTLMRLVCACTCISHAHAVTSSGRPRMGILCDLHRHVNLELRRAH